MNRFNQTITRALKKLATSLCAGWLCVNILLGVGCSSSVPSEPPPVDPTIAWVRRHGGSAGIDREQTHSPIVALSFPIECDLLDSDIDRIATMGELRALDLPAGISDTGIARLKPLRKLDRLRLLDNTKITDDALRTIRTFERLEALELSGTRITDAGLAHVKSLTNLQELGLDETRITDAGLVNLRQMVHLRWLTLDSTLVDDAGIAEIVRLRDLSHLSLNCTRVTDAGLALLAGLRLAQLHLAGTRIGDPSVKYLARLTDMAELDVFNTAITTRGLALLRQSLPNCRITGKGK